MSASENEHISDYEEELREHTEALETVAEVFGRIAEIHREALQMDVTVDEAYEYVEEELDERVSDEEWATMEEFL